MLDSTGFAELVARRPFLYHRIWHADGAKVESILSNGLERVESVYDGFWISRPGHVYIGDALKVRALKLEQDDPPSIVVRIETALLEAPRLNPDEDYFLTQDFAVDHLDGVRACRRFGLQFPPSKWAWEWARYLGMSFPNLGEWADAVDLGRDPAATRYSASKGALAYDGVIPPAALRLVSPRVFGLPPGHPDNAALSRLPARPVRQGPQRKSFCSELCSKRFNDREDKRRLLVG